MWTKPNALTAASNPATSGPPYILTHAAPAFLARLAAVRQACDIARFCDAKSMAGPP
jgi:hypothetical protein